MAAGNTITVVGNLVREVELKYTGSGQAVGNFSLACNRRWQNRQSQEWEEKVSFFNITVWGSLAENLAESAPKGSRLIVDGRLEQQTWDDKESGDKRSKVEIVADEVGISMRYATAEVTKVERSDGAKANGNEKSFAAAAEEPW